jgi:hypothetical protein
MLKRVFVADLNAVVRFEMATVLLSGRNHPSVNHGLVRLKFRE